MQGRVIEIYGPEASGKTTLALHVIAEAQKQGGLSHLFFTTMHSRKRKERKNYYSFSFPLAISVRTQDISKKDPRTESLGIFPLNVIYDLVLCCFKLKMRFLYRKRKE